VFAWALPAWCCLAPPRQHGTKISSGVHVDLSCGALHLASPENAIVEVHAGGALVRPLNNQLTLAEITILGPGVLQIAARRGSLEFSYHQGFQLLPEGETHRIYLDAPTEPQKPPGAGAPSVSSRRKVAFFIVAGGVTTGLAIWESPAKP
jgi:hypothetical protein